MVHISFFCVSSVLGNTSVQCPVPWVTVPKHNPSWRRSLLQNELPYHWLYSRQWNVVGRWSETIRAGRSRPKEQSYPKEIGKLTVKLRPQIPKFYWSVRSTTAYTPLYKTRGFWTFQSVKCHQPKFRLSFNGCDGPQEVKCQMEFPGLGSTEVCNRTLRLRFNI